MFLLLIGIALAKIQSQHVLPNKITKEELSYISKETSDYKALEKVFIPYFKTNYSIASNRESFKSTFEYVGKFSYAKIPGSCRNKSFYILPFFNYEYNEEQIILSEIDTSLTKKEKLMSSVPKKATRTLLKNLPGGGWCGSAGCHYLVASESKGVFKIEAELFAVSDPIVIKTDQCPILAAKTLIDDDIKTVFEYILFFFDQKTIRQVPVKDLN